MIHNVLCYLEASCRQYPDRLAMADARQGLTYRQVWQRVSDAGTALARAVGQENVPIAVCIRHDVEDLLMFFSVVYSGNFYVPVDPSLPETRLRQMAETVRPAAVLARDGDALPFDGPRIEFEGLHAEGTDDAPWKRRKDGDPLYVIFTSGSTGAPKGVAVSHRSVIDMAEQFCGVFGFAPGTVFGNQAPFDFDVSVKDVYIAMKVGGTVEILEKRLFSFPKLLIERMNERRVDTVIWAVPALKILSALRAFSRQRPMYLKNVMFSGEIMPLQTLRYWMEQLPEARYVNLYGPTEITCNCTYYVVEDPEALADAVPIGQAFPNCQVFLLDGDRPVTGDGEAGELCVSGSCLALGYYRQPETTAAAFPQNPLVTDYPERIYRTGDLGCLRDGVLMFLGRQDTQVKHMGHRIELAEIELCANGTEGVAASACVYDGERARLTLFYQGAAQAESVAARLRERLPKYMQPARLCPVREFPATRTGKIDRAQLLALARGETNHG